jgi:hypothetical protein
MTDADPPSFPLQTSSSVEPARPLAWQNALDAAPDRHGVEARRGLLRRIVAGSEDLVLLVLVVLLIPIVIMLAGAPVVIVVRLLAEAATRW